MKSFWVTWFRNSILWLENSESPYRQVTLFLLCSVFAHANYCHKWYKYSLVLIEHKRQWKNSISFGKIVNFSNLEFRIKKWKLLLDKKVIKSEKRIRYYRWSRLGNESWFQGRALFVSCWCKHLAKKIWRDKYGQIQVTTKMLITWRLLSEESVKCKSYV